MLSQLPLDVNRHLVQFFHPLDILRQATTCKQWLDISHTMPISSHLLRSILEIFITTQTTEQVDSLFESLTVDDLPEFMTDLFDIKTHTGALSNHVDFFDMRKHSIPCWLYVVSQELINDDLFPHYTVSRMLQILVHMYATRASWVDFLQLSPTVLESTYLKSDRTPFSYIELLTAWSECRVKIKTQVILTLIQHCPNSMCHMGTTLTKIHDSFRRDFSCPPDNYFYVRAHDRAYAKTGNLGFRRMAPYERMKMDKKHICDTIDEMYNIVQANYQLLQQRRELEERHNQDQSTIKFLCSKNFQWKRRIGQIIDMTMNPNKRKKFEELQVH